MKSEPLRPRKSYRGKPFLLWFAVALFLILITGLAMTYGLAGILRPILQQKKEHQRTEQQKIREQAIQAEGRK
jgi:membrane-bound metal-dependent hydrolase YbcI (DUF457 family)